MGGVTARVPERHNHGAVCVSISTRDGTESRTFHTAALKRKIKVKMVK